MGGTTAKASLIRDGEPTHGARLLRRRLRERPSGDAADDRRGRGRRRRRQHRLARRRRRASRSARTAPAPIPARSATAAAAPSRPSPTPTWCSAGSIPDNFLGGQMKLDAEGAARGIEEKIAEPLGLDTVAAAQAIVEIAIAKMSLAVREVSVAKGYDPRDFALVASGGAGPLHVMAIARELHIPTVIVPLFPSHFSALGMLLADERHDFIRTFYSDLAGVDFADLVAAHDEMVRGRQGEPAPRAATPRTRSISTCAMSARSSRCRCRSRSRSSRRATTGRSARRSTRSTSTATRTTRRRSRSRWSISGSPRSATHRARVSRRSSATADAHAGERARGLLRERREAGALPGLSRARRSAPARDRRPGADPGARHHDRAVRAATAAWSRRRAS